ncbi:MAG TPA: VCBS repeat-containing protein [Chlorobiota bacterium]|nr:VCBS repeat-containing protein [Chlorobiota bacterium]
MITQFTKLMLTLSVGVVFCAVPCNAQGEATPLKQLFTLEKFGGTMQLLPDFIEGEDWWSCALSPKGYYNLLWRFAQPGDTTNRQLSCSYIHEEPKYAAFGITSGAAEYGDFNGDGLRDWIDGDGWVFWGDTSRVPTCNGEGGKSTSLVMDLDKDGYDDAISRGGIAWGHPTRPLQARSSISVERVDTVVYGGGYLIEDPFIIFPARVHDTAVVMYSVLFQSPSGPTYDERWQYVQTLNEDDIRSHAPTIRTAGPRNAVRRIKRRLSEGYFYPSLSYYRNDRYVIVSGDTIYELTPTSLIPQRGEQQRFEPAAKRPVRLGGWSPIDTLETADGYYFFTFDNWHGGNIHVSLFEVTDRSDPFPERTGYFYMTPELKRGGYSTRASFFPDQNSDGKYEIAISYKPDSCRGEFDPECWTTRIFDVFGSLQSTSVGESGHSETTDITLSRCVLRWTNATAEPITVRTVDNLGKLLGVLPATAEVLRNGLPLPPSMCPRGMVHVQIVWNGGMKTATFMNDAG